MTQCLTQETIEGYRRFTLGSAEAVRAVEAHLAECAACRDAVWAAAQGAAAGLLRKVTLPIEEAVCPEDERLFGYVDGEMDAVEQEIVAAHIANCARCAEVTAALRALRTQMEGYDGSVAEKLANPDTLWARLRARWTVPPRRAVAWAGGSALAAATLAGILFWVFVRPLQTQVALLRTQQNSLQQQDARLQQKIAKSDVDDAQVSQTNKRLQNQYQMAMGRLRNLQKQYATQTTRLGVLASESVNGKLLIPSDMIALNPPLDLTAGENKLNGFGLLQPVGTMVRSNRPLFRWKEWSGATGYQVQVTDAADISRSLAQSGNLPSTATTWTPKEPLPAGRRLRWSVTAFRADGKIYAPKSDDPKPYFQILSDSEAKALQQQAALCAHSPLRLGLLYASYGLLDDAEAEFEKADPHSAPVQKLIENLHSLRHRK